MTKQPERHVPFPPQPMPQAMPIAPAPMPQTLHPPQQTGNHALNRLPQTPEQLVDGLPDSDLLALQTALIEEYREKHPELNEFELYITAEVNALLDEAKRNGVFIQPKDAIEFGITQFKKKMGTALRNEHGKLTAESKPPITQNSALAAKPDSVPQTKEVNRMALNLDLNPSPSAVAKLSPEDIWNMPREQFLALDRKIRQQHYR